jgi:predicted nucleotidyltransferase
LTVSEKSLNGLWIAQGLWYILVEAPSAGDFRGQVGRQRVASPARAVEGSVATERALSPVRLDEIIRRIVAVAHPEQIILFGSAARGAMGRHSDVDLLVIKAGANRLDLMAQIYQNLHGVGEAVDVIVVTPEDVERYRHSHPVIIAPALQEGRVLYAA